MSDVNEVIFYHNPRSRAQMVHFMLEEVGTPYRIVPVDFEKGDNRTPEFLEINPMGKLPTIVHRGVPVTETGAIIAYLADAFPRAGLAPATDAPARGTWLRWIMFGAGVFEPALLHKLLKMPDVPRMTAGFGSYEDAIAALDTMVRPGPWILGDRYSAADVYVGAQLAWAASFGAPGIKENERLAAYIERITARPAYQRSQGG